METKNNNESFTYTYSAKRQEEIKAIRQKYIPPEEDKMERLRRLDRSTTQKGTMVSIAVGTVSALILGVGMSCVLVWDYFALGIIVGVIGIIGVALAFPIFTRITKNQREKIAPEIKRLSDELLGQK